MSIKSRACSVVGGVVGARVWEERGVVNTEAKLSTSTNLYRVQRGSYSFLWRRDRSLA